MAIRVQRHANVCKLATLLDGLDVIPLKWRVCGCGLNRFVHEGVSMSNVKVHVKTPNRHVYILGQKRNAAYNSNKYCVLNESGKISSSVYVSLFFLPHIFPIDLLRCVNQNQCTDRFSIFLFSRADSDHSDLDVY